MHRFHRTNIENIYGLYQAFDSTPDLHKSKDRRHLWNHLPSSLSRENKIQASLHHSYPKASGRLKEMGPSFQISLSDFPFIQHIGKCRSFHFCFYNFNHVESWVPEIIMINIIMTYIMFCFLCIIHSSRWFISVYSDLF